MQLLNRFDTPFYRLFGKAKPVPGDVGVELELEGNLTFPEDPWWTYKEEGSLRGGGEYVLKKPVTMAVLPDVLLSLQKMLDAGKPKNSIRCSTHIHVNITDLTPRQVWQFLLAYYLLEPLLMRTQPKKRWGNLFSLTMEYAESIYIDLMRDSEAAKKLPFGSFVREYHRYAALNLVAINKFGSVEFRFLDAMTDTGLIQAWCRMLRMLVDRGAHTPPDQLLKMYDELTPQEFLSHFLGDGANLVFNTVGRASQSLNSLIHTNYDYVYELAHMLLHQRFEMPSAYWEPDFAEEMEVAFTGNPFDWGAAADTAALQANTPVESVGIETQAPQVPPAGNGIWNSVFTQAANPWINVPPPPPPPGTFVNVVNVVDEVPDPFATQFDIEIPDDIWDVFEEGN